MIKEDNLGSTIMNARKKLGISQRELARRISVSNNTIARLESGERKTTNSLILKKISYVLNINYIEVLKQARFSDEDIIWCNKKIKK